MEKTNRKNKALTFSAKAMEEASVVEGPSLADYAVKVKKKQVLTGYNKHIL